ncbi:MAG: DUF4476 domain-containing protein, partial [Bacteroidales bacterium]|nr:DUF4476 domain-containing protein [Bacteroidales bacterium]
MIRSITLLIAFLLIKNAVMAQVVYNVPKSFKNENVNIEFIKVKPSSSSYYVNYKVKNIGDGILTINRKEATLIQNHGEIRPTSGMYTLKANESKTIYNEFRIKPPVKSNAEIFKLLLDGISYAKISGSPLKGEKLIVAEKATQTIGDFGIKVMEYNIHSDRKYAQVKCTFNGSGKQMGNINLTKLTVEGGDAEIVKKGKALMAGESYTFSINIKPNADEFALNWNGVFSIMKLADVKIDTIVVKSTTYKEAVKEPKKEEAKASEKEEKKVAENCELSFSDYSSLKTDIETEINSGGKPVEMANEFLLEKGCISVAQVLEFMAVFNLDGKRLEFAKMAYKYTSDKHKYHMA